MAFTIPTGAAIFSDEFPVLASDTPVFMVIASDALVFTVAASDALIFTVMVTSDALVFMTMIASGLHGCHGLLYPHWGGYAQCTCG